MTSAPTQTSKRLVVGREDPTLARASVGIALLRGWCGLWFLLVAYPKMPLDGLDHWAFPAELERALRDFIQFGALEWYRPYLESLARQKTLVAGLLAGAELAIGLCLLAGFFTRTAAVLAIAITANYLCATANIHRAYAGLDLWVIMACFIVLLARGGQHFGADRLWSKDA